MSLINQMLRDLDARRGPASSTETAALQGMGLADAHAGSQYALMRRAGWAIGLVLAGILIQQGYPFFLGWRAHQEPAAPAVTASAVTSAQPVSPARPTPVIPTPPASSESNAKALPASQPKQAVIHSHAVATAAVAIQTPANIVPPQAIKPPLSPVQKAQRRFDRAQGLLTAGQLRSAANELQAALELDPKLDEARLQLATVYLYRGRTDRASQLLEAGHKIAPDNTGISLPYARLLADQGEYRNALDILDGSLQQSEVDAETLALAAGLQYRMKQFATSASHYREALARRPDQGVWWMGLGVSLEHNQQPDEALAAYRRASVSALDSTLLSFVTGRVNALSGRTD